MSDDGFSANVEVKASRWLRGGKPIVVQRPQRDRAADGNVFRQPKKGKAAVSRGSIT
jgi:hypothetical protein